MELKPDNPSSYINLSTVYIEKGDFEAAKNVLLKALELDPKNGIIYNNLAVCYFYLRDKALAQDYLRKAKELGYPVHPEFERMCHEA
jgi:Flp pilus assembly protein TadD